MFYALWHMRFNKMPIFNQNNTKICVILLYATVKGSKTDSTTGGLY